MSGPKESSAVVAAPIAFPKLAEPEKVRHFADIPVKYCALGKMCLQCRQYP
jgi:hypothetical protein